MSEIYKNADDTNEEFFKIKHMTKDCVDIIKSIFPTYIETYGNWFRMEFIYVPKTMLSFNWKNKIKDNGIDIIKQEFIRRGYNLKRHIQTINYTIGGQQKKMKIIVWEIDKKLY